MCVCLFPYVSYTGSSLVDFGSGKCVFVCLFPYVRYTGSLLVDFGSGKCVFVCLFSYVSQLHWFFASRLRQWEVCVCLFVCSRMSVTLALC